MKMALLSDDILSLEQAELEAFADLSSV